MLIKAKNTVLTIHFLDFLRHILYVNNKHNLFFLRKIMTFSSSFTPSKATSLPILCLGDIMLDAFVHGSVTRISPEGPIPVFHYGRQERMLGGAGNVIGNLHSLGCCVHTFLPHNGGDVAKTVGKMLNDLKGVTPHILDNSPYVLPFKKRYIAQHQQMLRVDEENASQHLSLRDENFIKEYLTKNIQRYALIILSDYAKGFFNTHLLQWVIELANKHAISVLVDPKGPDFSRYQGAFCLTPNKSELELSCGRPLEGMEDILTASRTFIHDYHLKSMLVTLSEKGMVYVTPHDHAYFKATARDVFDVSGAGDTVIATFGSALAKGQSPAQAAAFANIAGGLVVQKMGTATITNDELEQAVYNNHMHTINTKIHALDYLEKLVHTWKQQGLRVGFTNGCFDLLHLGHLHSLKEAKKQCDKLIVAVNSDASVKKNKGEERPIQSEEVRLNVLAHLEIVDAVILFKNDTPIDMIHTLTPNILFKGQDYTQENVVGGRYVSEKGGQVILLPLYEGQSTTSLVNRLKKNSL